MLSGMRSIVRDAVWLLHDKIEINIIGNENNRSSENHMPRTKEGTKTSTQHPVEVLNEANAPRLSVCLVSVCQPAAPQEQHRSQRIVGAFGYQVDGTPRLEQQPMGQPRDRFVPARAPGIDRVGAGRRREPGVP